MYNLRAIFHSPRRRRQRAFEYLPRFERLEPRLTLTTVNNLGAFSTFHTDFGVPHAENSQGQITLSGAVAYTNYVGSGTISIGVSGNFPGSPQLNVPTIFQGNGTASTMTINFNSNNNNIQNVCGYIGVTGRDNGISAIFGSLTVTGDNNTILGVSGAGALAWPAMFSCYPSDRNLY